MLILIHKIINNGVELGSDVILEFCEKWGIELNGHLEKARYHNGENSNHCGFYIEDPKNPQIHEIIANKLLKLQGEPIPNLGLVDKEEELLTWPKIEKLCKEVGIEINDNEKAYNELINYHSVRNGGLVLLTE